MQILWVHLKVIGIFIIRAMVIFKGVEGIRIQFVLAIPPYNMKECWTAISVSGK